MARWLVAAAALAGAVGLTLLPARAQSGAGHLVTPGEAVSGAPRNGEPLPKGAQVLPLPAPDGSTAAAQERGNAALRANRNPRAGAAPTKPDQPTSESR
jgi:hypothetical protein